MNGEQLCRSLRALIALLCVTAAGDASALEWITTAPNSAYSRDLSMGASTVALSGTPQSQSINPAGLELGRPRSGFRASLVVNPGGAWQIAQSWDDKADRRTDSEHALDGLRMLLCAAAVESPIITAAVMPSQPVMLLQDGERFHDFETRSPLDEHQNSLLVSLALHPRVSVGGRVDRYYCWDYPQGESYSYGVILRPRGVNLGVQYQRFPGAETRVWHPLDRRTDQATTAGLGLVREHFTLTTQVMNLTSSDGRAFLEPHAGAEWRPVRALALRAGGMQFSRSRRWAWTAGIGLLDANWLRSRIARLLVPDDVLQLAVAVVYLDDVPELGVTSLTCAWRF